MRLISLRMPEVLKRRIPAEPVRSHTGWPDPPRQDVFLHGLRRHTYSPSQSVYEYGADSIGAQQRLYEPVRIAGPGTTSRKLHAEPEPIRLRDGCVRARLHARTGFGSIYNASYFLRQGRSGVLDHCPLPSGHTPQHVPADRLRARAVRGEYDSRKPTGCECD